MNVKHYMLGCSPFVFEEDGKEICSKCGASREFAMETRQVKVPRGLSTLRDGALPKILLAMALGISLAVLANILVNG